MPLRESIRLAIDTLRAHKLRSFLTLLGIIIAVTTLIAVVSVIEGMNRYIAERLAKEVGAVAWGGRFDVKSGNKEHQDAGVRGATPNIINMGNEQVDQGRFL